MTDDPRLEAVKMALETTLGINAPGNDALYESAREFCAMIRAFLGEDAERKEVMPHPGPTVSDDNATAPVAAGADPPWLDEAVTEACHAFHKTYTTQSSQWRAVARAVLRVANAQPVSVAEVEAAAREIFSNQSYPLIGSGQRLILARRALEAAAKVRAGG